MGKSSRVAECHADDVRALVAIARGRANRALDELAQSHRPESKYGARPALTVVPGPGLPVRTLPAAHFHKPYALTLEALELTLHGYCVYRKYGWERQEEAVFCLRQPPWWRRLLRPAPLLALSVDARDGRVVLEIGPARCAAVRNRSKDVIRLDRDSQQALVRIHREQSADRSLVKKIVRRIRRSD